MGEPAVMSYEAAMAEEPPLAPMFSLEAERSVLGAMLVDPERGSRVLDHLGESDFYRDGHRRLYRAMVDLWRTAGMIDPVGLGEHLRASGDLEAVGGVGYMAELWDYVTTAANIEYHARIVTRHAVRRKIHEAAAAVQVHVKSSPEDSPEALQAEAERLIHTAAPAAAGGSVGFISASDLLAEEMERLERIVKGEEPDPGVRTGLRCVDDLVCGFQPEDLVILAARPSMGKSGMAFCNIAADAAIRQQKRTAVFSIESPSRAVLRRILGSEARVSMYGIQKRRGIQDHEYPRLGQASALIHQAPLHVDHTPGMTLDQMRRRLRDLNREHEDEVALVVVDYLQLMTVPKARGRVEEVSEISRGLKRLAGEFGVPVVALSQLSRAVEQRPDKRPMMSDLRDSGTIEQDADHIMFLYRPEYYFGPSMEVGRGKDKRSINIEGKAEIILGKVREGETGTAACLWEGRFTHFEDPTPRMEP